MLNKDLAEARRALESSEQSRTKSVSDVVVLRKLLDDHTTEHERTAELNKLQEAEVRTLRQQLAKVTTDLDLSQRDSNNTISRLRQDLDVVSRESVDFKRRNEALEQRANASASRVTILDARVEDLERSQQAHDLELEVVRNEAAEKVLQEREQWERQVAEVKSQFQVLEDAAVEARRDKDAARREAESLRSALQAEKASGVAKDEARRKAEEKSEQQHAVLADYDRINGDLRAELASTKARLVVAEEKAGRTVVSAADPFTTRRANLLRYHRSSTFEYSKRLCASRTSRWTACAARRLPWRRARPPSSAP